MRSSCRSSYPGGLDYSYCYCLCVQDISVTLCEENIMFWEVSGIGSKVIGLLSL